MNSESKIPSKNSWRYQLSQIFMVLGLGTLVFSLGLATQQKEPFSTWLYLWSWWSYILFIDGCVFRRRGESLLLTYPHRFIFLTLWSIGFWFIYEAFNLRLQNWTYLELPPQQIHRWIGYFVAFATVVPGLMETADLLDTTNVFKDHRVKPLGFKRRVSLPFMGLGIAMIALPMIWPQFFFPLIWGAFLFLIEPINERIGAPSLLNDWREGKVRRIYILLATGFLCGILWEWWNSFAITHWEYNIPFVGDWKLFEMPLLGYLGFPIFALGTFSMASLAQTLWDRASKPWKFIMLPSWMGMAAFICHWMDKMMVKPLP